MGHIERYRNMLFLPSWMTSPSNDGANALFVLKQKCISGRAPYHVYVKAVLSILQGKTGYVRSVSKMSIQGSMRMVIEVRCMRQSPPTRGSYLMAAPWSKSIAQDKVLQRGADY